MEKRDKRSKGRRKAHVQQTSSHGMNTQGSQIPTCGPFLKEYLKNVHRNSNIRYAKNGIKNFNDYKDEYNFQESWQNVGNQSDFDRKYLSWKNDTQLMRVAQLILLVFYGISLWFISAYRIFQIGTLAYYLTALAMIALIVDILIKQNNDKEERNKDQPIKITETFRKHCLSVFFIIYLLFLIIEQASFSTRFLPLLIIDIPLMVKLYKEMKKTYIKVKMKLPSYWRNQIQIAQLVIGCLALVHIFSALLCLAAETDETYNWTLSISRMKSGWEYKYLYSFYFACTTMFTVGYGDITPKNHWQIMTILMVQAVGIINMGYVINQVGRFLSKMNENEEVLYRNILNSQKLSQSYQLPEQKSRKVTAYLVNNQIASNKFNVQEEDTFLKTLSDQVRQQVTSHHKFDLVKTSVFFLCHWTKRFQRTIADKLIRQVYSPEQCLLQTLGNEKLYLLSRGAVQIQANFNNRQRPLCEKRLVLLERDPKKDVHFNVYGYVQLASGLKVNLKAVAKDYSICFCINRQNFLSAVEESQVDLEYFHEIRSRIQESKCKEAFQAPIINSTKQHYLPNAYFILKKQGFKVSKGQKRKNYQKRKVKKLFVILSQQKDEAKLEPIKQLIRGTIIQNKKGRSYWQQDSQLKIQESSILKNQSLLQFDEQQRKQGILDNFDQRCNFSYFKNKFNPKKVIHNYNNKNTKSKSMVKSSPIGKSDRMMSKIFQVTTD